jgi:glycosyltransferase involved in cell wall biosynthesis
VSPTAYQPGKTDTFGNVILEALASGVPVAAYPVPGLIDILNGKHVGAISQPRAGCTPDLDTRTGQRLPGTRPAIQLGDRH